MSLLSYFHLHNFFRNKEMNHFYVAIAIIAFAEALINIFVPIYLYRLGYPVYTIIFFYFLISLSFVIFSYPGARIVARVGVKHSMLYSSPFLMLYYLGLRVIGDHSWLFFILPIVLSWRGILFNYGYHLNYITHSDMKKRGREISFLSAIAVLANVAAPLCGGIIAFYAGFSWLFIVGSAFLIAGALPLFLTKESFSKISFTNRDMWKAIFSRKERGYLLSFTGYAVETIIGRIIWPIFLIVILMTVYKTGLVVTLSMIISLSLFYFIGNLTDKYDKIKLLKIGTSLYFVAWLGRIFADSTLKIFLIDSYKNMAEKILHVPWAAKSYDLAKQRGYFRFLVGREVIFNLSRIIILPLLIFLFYFDIYPFIISFIIAAVSSIGYVFLGKE